MTIQQCLLEMVIAVATILVAMATVLVAMATVLVAMAPIAGILTAAMAMTGARVMTSMALAARVLGTSVTRVLRPCAAIEGIARTTVLSLRAALSPEAALSLLIVVSIAAEATITMETISEKCRMGCAQNLKEQWRAS
jgi:hypothetical protein